MTRCTTPSRSTRHPPPGSRAGHDQQPGTLVLAETDSATRDDRPTSISAPGPRPSRRASVVRLLLAVPLISAAILAGCHSRDEAEIDGDSHGVPVTVTVRYSDAVFEALEPQGFFEPVFVSHHGGFFIAPGFMVFSYHQGYDERRPAIHGILLAGDSPGDDSLWYWPLHYGVQSASVPIRPGHHVTITLRGEGGERGEQTLGTITPSAAPNQHITILLDGAGAHIVAGDAPALTPAWSAPPPAPPAGAYSQPPPPPPGGGSQPPPPPPAPPRGATANPPPPPPPPPGQ